MPLLIVLRHFPTLKAAEHEVVERIAASAKDLGWKTRIVDIDNTFKFKQIKLIEDEADLVLDIHYEYPKFLKPKSVGAVWTPTAFMKDWDLPYVWENQLSHDFLVHTESQKIVDLLTLYRPNEEFGILNHSIPLSWLDWVHEAPRNQIPRAFYAGINWSKLSGRSGRHNDFFKLLDAKDVLDIYGPKKISHVIPWKGFESYRGEIPFDGRSILRKARESGISLVLSAEQHFKEEVISSRLFEGTSAGNAIIADKHPFIVKHLGKNARYLDLEKGDAYAAQQLLEYVKELQSEPKTLFQLQQNSENIFKEKFNLTDQLGAVLNHHRRTKPIKPENLEIDVLVLGSSNNDIYSRLKALNFSRIEFTSSKVLDMQDLQSLAKSLNFKNYLVLNGNTDFLDNFSEQVGKLAEEMAIQNTKVGLLATVLLTQDGSKFQPVIAPVSNVLPLNGLLIQETNGTPSSKLTLKRIPALRVESLGDLSYIATLDDVHDFLKQAAMSSSKEDLQESSRVTLSRKLKEISQSTTSDIAEEIRRLPKSRKAAAMLALGASIPGMKPFVLVIKWFYRSKNR